MKHTFNTFLFFLLILPYSMTGQTNYYKQQYYITGETVQSVSHIATVEGGMMTAANMLDNVTSSGYVSLTKTQSNGMVQWNKHFGPVTCDFENIVQSPDSGYFFCYYDYLAPSSYFATKTDQYGNVVFSKQIDVPVNYYINSAPQVFAKNNGGFYVMSTILDTVLFNYVWHLYELSPSGNVVWSGGYHNRSDKSYCADMDTCSNGDVVLLGSWYNSSAGVHGPLVNRIAQGGTLIWAMSYEAPLYDMFPTALTRMTGDNFTIATTLYNIISFQDGMCFMKIDAQGNPMWSYNYSAVSFSPCSVERSSGDHSLIVGNGSVDSYYLHADSMGSPVCVRRYIDEFAMSIDTLTSGLVSILSIDNNNWRVTLRTTDLCGAGCDDQQSTITSTPLSITATPDSGNINMPLLQTDAFPLSNAATAHGLEICSILGTPEPIQQQQFSVYPVPAGETVNVSSDANVRSVEIIDVHGCTVHTAYPSSKQFSLYVGDLACGIYFLRIYTNDEVSIRRFTVTH